MPDRLDPYAGYNFSVELDGITRAGFRNCSGLDSTTNAGTYREGTDRSSAARLLPGRVDYGPLVLRRGFSGDAALFQWWQAVAEGNLDRRNVSVVLLDEKRQEVARWNLVRAWPTKYEPPSLHGLGNGIDRFGHQKKRNSPRRDFPATARRRSSTA